MREVPKYNLWWPEFESPPSDMMPFIMGRVTDCDVVTDKHVRTKGIAVQAGGHVGLYARQLAKYFSFVYTFEPVVETFCALKRNVERVPNIIADRKALGETQGFVNVQPRAGGKSAVSEIGDHVELITIDSLALPRCDLIYLDIEGYELSALAGARATIALRRPTIVLEALKERRVALMDWAQRNQYKCTARLHADWVFEPL